ncbi:MAG: hypothetical protein C5B50_21035 [Verrucomicrobia bacterium]|nr:MAG: hypothetical protein C5B50_21035 [Verrucomicrobiota bacterium]
MGPVAKGVLTFACAFVAASALGQGGTVNFNNVTASAPVYTNGLGAGGTRNYTAIAPNGFYYSLFTAASTTTTIDSSLQDLFTPTWTFTGVYATNTGSSGGLLNGGSSVAVSSWAPGVTSSFVVVGWSAVMGANWFQVSNQLRSAYFNGSVWSGPNWPAANGAFLGASSIAQGAAGGGTGPSPPPPLHLFGSSALGSFDLYVRQPPPPPPTFTSWTNSLSGKWEQPTNWFAQLPPNSTLSVFITNSANKTVTIDSATSSGYSNELTVAYLAVGAPTGSTNTLSLLNAGSTVPLHISSGFDLQSGGNLTLTNSRLQVDQTMTLGTNGTGLAAATFSNATVSANNLSIGSASSALASLTLQSNSTLTVTSNLIVQSASSSLTNSLNLTSGSLIATNSMTQVGPLGTGQLLISGGTHTLRQVRLGSATGAGHGFFHMTGGKLTILGTGLAPGAGLTSNGVGQDGGDMEGSGTSYTIAYYPLNSTGWLSNGTAIFGAFYVGSSPGYTGTYLQGGGVMTVLDNMVVGDSCAQANNGPFGSVILFGGTLYVTNAAHNAWLDVRNGSIVLYPGATLIADNLILTNSCGQFINNGGTLIMTNQPPVLSPDLDADGDGQSSIAELQAGTDPLNPNSVFKLLSIVRTNIAGLSQATSNDLRLDWTSVGQHSYVVQTNGNLKTGAFHDLSAPIMNTNPAGVATNSFYVYPGGVTNGTRFYRIRLFQHTNDPAASFSRSNNPAGPWSYGYALTLGATPILYTNTSFNRGVSFWSDLNLDAQAYHNAATTNVVIGGISYGPGSFGLNPGQSGLVSIARLTTPTTGWYHLTGSFFGQDGGGTCTTGYILTNGVPALSGPVFGFGPGSGPSFDLWVALNARDPLDFVASFCGDFNYFPSTGLSTQIIGP